MSGGFGEAASRPTQSSSLSNNNGSNNGDGGNFECSICLDLAQDPVVTLCGHLFCWPCIYKWLHMPSRSQECPICKAFIEEGKLVPLYGRGKYPTEARSQSVPNRPAGQRPENSRRPDRNANAYVQNGAGLIGGFGPAITATYGNFTFSFGGFIPSIFSVHMHALNGPHMYGNGGRHVHEVRHQRDHHHEVSPLLVIGLLFLFALLWEPNI
ncbi:hypothetical protein L1887_26520 [Cichorium endivia]|nr:hypothetical protein L1887_26520 [Cichorium endivia]